MAVKSPGSERRHTSSSNFFRNRRGNSSARRKSGCDVRVNLKVPLAKLMSSIDITLPDGSYQQVPAGTTPLDIAKKISPRLADDAVVARVNGDFFDLTRPLESDASLQILTSKNPEGLEVYRHSTAHLLALAVQQLYPEVKLGIGPPTDTGFYYDFYREQPFQPEDLEKIEAKMWELQKQDLPYERKLRNKSEGLEKYKKMGEFMKCELIDEKADETF